MALTKVTKSGLADDSVDASKIEDGTVVAADINDGTITNAKLAGSIANNKLANPNITLNGSSLALGGSASVLAFDWQSVVTSNTTMVSGKGYFVNTTSGAITMTLPASPSAGDYVAIKDYAATFQTNSCTIGRNSSNIQGTANDSELKTTRASVVLVYVDGTKGWLFTNESNVADLQKLEYIAATGGTESTSGNYKIHTFNSSSNFVVSSISNQSHTVEYLVVAGGGGGAGGGGIGGGGGAGGFRTNYPSPDTGATTIAAQTYPITVGGGGSGNGYSGGNASNGNGSTSTFSTITSAGGGGGGTGPASPGGGGQPGGSGGGENGGHGSGNTTYRGTGNTPPVSPPQGNPGGVANDGTNAPLRYAAGGGGGASTAGSNGSGAPREGGAGGSGTANSITGSSVTYAGGGGGGGPQGGGSASGGGGYGVNCSPGSGATGTANKGGGGGGGGTGTSGTGGSGVVILRYKYQN
jgi:hypothetical protein